MNYKTTLFLFAAFIGLAGGYFLWQRGSPPTEVAAEKKPGQPESVTTRDLIEPKLGDVVKIVCKKGNEEWVFEKVAQADAAGRLNWRMTTPVQTAVAAHEVDRIVRQLTGLKYDVSYKPGDPGAVSAKQAGLEPPEWTVMLTDAAGLATTVEIGRPASDLETYVRLAGQDTVVVAKSNLKPLIKEKAIEYRDLQLWTFNPEQVVRVEVVDRSNASAPPVTYAFVREGPKWAMDAPAVSKANSQKVDELLRTMKTLRANKWEDNRREKLEIYGLANPAWTVRATVEEKVKSEAKKDSEEDAGEPEEEPAETTRQTIHELHISDRAPIGDETKTYLRVGDDAFVGTIAKSMADKFKPVMAEWRDMHVTTANVAEASRVELLVADGKAAMVKDSGRWKFEGDGGAAEDATVKQLLKTIQDMTAQSFTEGEKADLAGTGLAQPRAEIRLTVPGAENVERIAVGGYTDPNSKRLVYVRRNEGTSLAKVRATDAEPLLQNTRTYRDRTIVDTPAGQFEQLTLTTQSPFSADPVSVTLKQSDGQWAMSAPISAPVRQDRVEQLVAALAVLRAESIVADEGELSAYGLHAPSATIQWHYAAPAESGTEGKAAEQPKSVELIFTEHDGKYYAKRKDKPAIYQVSADFYKQLFQELRSQEVQSFDDSKVTAFSIRAGEQSHRFEKKGDRWIYASEPDIALDANKVKNLLLQLKDLKTDRYVRYDSRDLASFGLQPSFHEARIELEGGASQSLLVSKNLAEKGSEKGYYAASDDRGGVFLLQPESVARFQVSIADLEKAR